MKRFRHVSLYYRDENKVFRKVPGLLIMIDNRQGSDVRLVKVYTLKGEGIEL
jgi:hypothetical protein